MNLYCVNNQTPELQLDPGDDFCTQLHSLTTPPDAMRVVPTLSPFLLELSFITDTDVNS